MFSSFFSFLLMNRRTQMNNKVITEKNNCIYKVITHTPSTSPPTNIYNVITYNHKRNYIVILLSLLCSVNTQAIELKQPIIQGSLIYGRAQKGEQVFLQQTELKQNSDGLFVFALPQDTEENLYLTTKQAGRSQIWTLPIEKRTWKEEIVNGLPPQKVSPSPENEKRIAKENALFAAGRTDTFYTSLPLCFSRPVSEKARISSTFGSRRILNGTKTAGHSGTDYALPIGAPVTAPADGIVKVAHPDMFLTGQTVLIDHGYSLYTSYSHLNQIEVKTGQHVRRGDKVGEIGMTGRSTGPHLHLVLSWFNTRVDPEFIFQKYGCPK